jgi:hypothetical protein
VSDSDSGRLAVLRRQLRVIAIVSAAERCGLAPLAADQLHTLAYLADALAPVWNMPILDGQRLKRRSGPMSPLVQHDVDRLVGCGVLEPQVVRHIRDADGNWRLDARYRLHREFADPIIKRALSLTGQAAQMKYVREVVYAASALGTKGITEAAAGDAAYADPTEGSVVDLAPWRPGAVNASSQVALHLGELMRGQVSLGRAELIHLYVRALYERLPRAA